jgi:thiamine-phosphate pyrophosphorylase
MRRRHPISKSCLPRIWLMTDERIGDIAAAIARLPKGAGIVFRYHATPPTDRRALFDDVRAQAKRHGHVLLLAGTPRQARAWGADGAHHRSLIVSQGLRSIAVHNRRELALAQRARADLVFASPVFSTRSHPGVRTLGPIRLGLMLGNRRTRAIALGGMNRARYKRLKGLGLYGWAAIDAFG